MVCSLAPACGDENFLKVKNEFSGVELSCIPSLSELEAILRLVGIHGPVPNYTRIFLPRCDNRNLLKLRKNDSLQILPVAETPTYLLDREKS